MKRIFLLLITLNTFLFSQNYISTYVNKRESILHDFSIYEWNLKKNAFCLKKSLPSIPRSFQGSLTYQYDGEHLYIIEHHETTLGIKYGFSLMTPLGPQWYFHPTISVKGTFSFLGATDLQVVLERTTRPENKQPGKYQIQAFDLLSEKLTTLFEEDFRPGLRATAAIKDHVHLIFLNDGRMLEADVKFGSVKEVTARFWQEQSDKWDDYVEDPNGARHPSPPKFVSFPFFSQDGDVFVPMIIREKNLWTREMVQAIWNQATDDERQRAIDQGLWPMKGDTFKGSDDVFVVFQYHTATRKITTVPVDKYTWLIKKTPYVEQVMLAKPPPYRFFFDDKEGVIARDRVIESKDPLKNGTIADTK